MYPVGGWLEMLGWRRPRAAVRRQAVPPTVIYLGLTSLLTDISTEMVVAALPMYLVGFLRLSPAQFGVVDGLYQGVSGLVQLFSAAVTDRLRRYKEVAAIGYAASACARVGLLLTAQWTSITGLLALDRLGKGIRTAPRDALISLSVDPEDLGTAFGAHRAMDACGAMLGPIATFVILSAIHNGFDVVFVVSLFCAVIGFAVLAFFVENRPNAGAVPIGSAPALATTTAMLGLLTEPRFRHLTLCALILSSTAIGDAFVYLIVQQRSGVSTGAFPLLYVGTSATFLLLALPAGRIADRVGRWRTFLAGHAVLLALYASLLMAWSGRWSVLMSVALLGAYYASTEGVLAALASAIIPPEIRASGLSVLTTVTAVAKLVSSMVFGLAWTRFGFAPAVLGFAVGLAVAIVVSMVALPRVERSESAI